MTKMNDMIREGEGKTEIPKTRLYGTKAGCRTENDETNGKKEV